MILVYAEHSGGAIRKGTLELLSAARQLAAELDTQITALALGTGAEAAAEALTAFVPRVAFDDAPQLDGREAVVTALQQAAVAMNASAVLLPANHTGLAVAPRLAVRLDAPLLEDITSLQVQDGKVVATRFSYLARVTETVRAESLPVVISVKGNAFPVAAQLDTPGETRKVSSELRPEDTRVTVSDRRGAQGGSVALAEATIIVAGGRGTGSAEGFSSQVEPLAAELGAGVGATRAVVDAGWRPFAEQIGQTGKTVSPELYLALGISGAVQHLSGMNRSKVIVAINRDADAPIFKLADYGIVADSSAVVPELLAALKERS